MRRPSIVLAALLLGTIGCSTSSVLVPEYMTVSPHALVYATPDTLHTLALSHSCTCPISWTLTKSDSTNWLHINPTTTGDQPTASGDQAKFPITIDRTLLLRDTSIGYLFVRTGEYQTQNGRSVDTVMIKAIR